MKHTQPIRGLLKRRCVRLCIALVVMIPTLASADGLMDAYRQARISDPTYQIATGTYQAAMEALPFAQAKLLPDVDFEADFDHALTQHYKPNNKVSTTASSFALSLTQSVFDASNWRSLKGARYSVQAARATYLAASQGLMLRVAQAYFTALEAHQVWLYSQVQTRALAKQLDRVQQRFDVGLDAITEVQETRAQYDTALAAELVAYNAVSNALENLRALTGGQYQAMMALDLNRMPLVKPQPAVQQAWVSRATLQNYSLQAASRQAQVAHQSVLASHAKHLPVVSATGSYTFTYYHNKDLVTDGVRRGTPKVGLGVDLPIYSGGALSAADRQAVANEAVARATMEQTRRAVVNNARQSYLGVVAGISLVQASRQAVVSRETALHSMEAAYDVGARGLTDVLDAQSDLFSAQKDYAKQLYGYLSAMLKLKAAAGTLSEKDLLAINHWFSKPVEVDRFYSPAPPVTMSTLKLPLPHRPSSPQVPSSPRKRRFNPSPTPSSRGLAAGPSEKSLIDQRSINTKPLKHQRAIIHLPPPPRLPRHVSSRGHPAT